MKSRKRSWANAAASKPSRPFYEAGRQGTKLRWVVLLLVPLGFVALPAAYWAFTDLRALDGSLEPLGLRAALAGLLLLTGLLFGPGLLVFCRIYPLCLTLAEDCVVVQTMSFFGTRERRLQLARFGAWSEHEGHIYTVRTPFATVKIAGWALPMILDRQAKTFSEAGLRRVLKAAAQQRKAKDPQ